MSVCVFVCLFVCHTFSLRFTIFLLSPMSKLFRDSESLGKSFGKKWSQIYTFLFGSGLKSPNKKNSFFLADFALQNMVETTLPDGLETSGQRANIGISLGVLSFCVLDDFFRFIKKIGFLGILGHPYCGIGRVQSIPGTGPLPAYQE